MEPLFDLTKHRELWDWMVHNPDAEKQDWPGWEKYGICDAWIFNFCFACETMEGIGCKKCPLFEIPCMDRGSLYLAWKNATGEKKVTYAEFIRDLPVKESFEGQVV